MGLDEDEDKNLISRKLKGFCILICAVSQGPFGGHFKFKNGPKCKDNAIKVTFCKR
jgi:hypothetical protein